MFRLMAQDSILPAKNVFEYRAQKIFFIPIFDIENLVSSTLETLNWAC